MATALALFTFLLLAYSVYSAPIPQNVSDGCNDLRNCRTMWGLVYGCLLTVFACVWTAVHPNVPQHDGDIWSFSSHVGLMMASLVSPEWILGTAWRQFMLSRRVSKKYKMVEGWTLTHSYFVVMDGFFDPSKGKVVVPEKLQKYPGIIEKTGNTRKAAITRKEILDRSKGDAISKCLVVLQLLWFIIQYVGRWGTHLNRSQLETMTLAYAALSVFVYVLWWNKPVNIQCAIHVTKETSDKNLDQPTPKTELQVDADLVQLSGPQETEVLFIFAVTGMIFGGIHCFAWSFPFPTHTEMILWRVSAIYITVAPVVAMFVGWVADQVGEAIGAGVILVPISVVYACARVILFVLTFSSLRSPPPDLYQTPSWSSFLPHLG
ncbi:uncharacterized protein EI90DRAFT_2972306 [Cantharellus anzutake]|uniref:uncharacterized protein n=1 Tax=Cantharellus anzutake TaxID=1750568 RepID=UPI001908BE1D|nr:uncharacterized protein EI90DRAFT_2972306 [Cantharellus anzutake]KAF8331690.1 hypothetical protein EI90DRAFT_2972306 [Cantharellus anzutake]